MSTDKTREAFEAWHKANHTRLHFDLWPPKYGNGKAYMYQATADAWTAWQASRSAALTEAAEVCRKLNSHGVFAAGEIERLRNE